MCGLVGFYANPFPFTESTAEEILRRMTACLKHRGPDDDGQWIDPAAGIALGQTRLAIVDLSPLGHQPMHSASGDWTIVFNGEIYNFQELRQVIASTGVTFRGHSDTEVLVEGFALWGVQKTIEKCIGMFAIAAWNHRERQLTLIRDRMGIKPLYYGRVGGGRLGETWIFGSELKAFHPHPHFEPRLNRPVVPLFLRHNYIPAPYSIYEHVWKLPPGSLLTIDAAGQTTGPHTYWSVRESAVQAGHASPFTGSVEEATTQLEELLESSIGLRMIADVPLGTFLSGGIDSSLVTAIMQKLSSRPVRTFSIGFEDPEYDESPFARTIARHLGTDHTEHIVAGPEALDVIPLLPTMFDE
ncbi:MAG: asparagine synthase (glutamine-hydrolyzing), partial [Planctomyces sp.]|nr:asparagine synthase (glutamine-hydrolyzing) [Planctomyces sp.]